MERSTTETIEQTKTQRDNVPEDISTMRIDTETWKNVTEIRTRWRQIVQSVKTNQG